MSQFKDDLNSIIRTFDGSKSKAADFIGVSYSMITKMLNSDEPPSRPVEELLRMKAIQCETAAREIPVPLPPIRRIPVVSWTTAGLAASYEDLANQIDDMVDSTTKDENAFAIEVEGDSMEREVHSGDRVVLEPNREASSGDMAYVRFADEAGGGGTLKWFYRTGPKGRVIKLVAENPDWPTTEHPVETVKFAYPVHNIIRRRPKRRNL
jgi:SOS-response transcriptional repressor LexA